MENVIVKTEKKQIKQYFKSLIGDLGKYGKLVLITRKGYWLFANVCGDILRSENQTEEKININNFNICTDRRILKDFTSSFLENGEGKAAPLYIFDDCISDGKNMFYFYCYFRSRGISEVFPRVYAASTSFLTTLNKDDQEEFDDQILEENERKYFLEFKERIRYDTILAPDDIARFYIQEMYWFQDAANPMVMDLPVFQKWEKNEIQEDIILSKEEFRNICSPSGMWEFIENRYDGLNPALRCDYFQLNNEKLYEKFSDLFFNFIVKCKYFFCDEEHLKVVFVPFAIVKSASIEKVWQSFKILLGDRKIYQKVIHYIGDKDPLDKLKEDESLSIAVFRALIYSLSDYVGFLFYKKILFGTGNSLCYDMNYLRFSCDVDFIESMEEEWIDFFKDPFDGDTYEDKINRCNLENDNKNNQLSIDQANKEAASERKIELVVRTELIRSKRNHSLTRKNKIITIEKLEKDIEEKFSFDSVYKKRLYLTKALVLLLDTSCFGNDIIVSENDNMIVRGFRSGKNSEILLPKGLKWVYPYYFAFYYLKDSQFYKQKYEQFSTKFFEYFAEKEYFEKNLIEKDVFKFFYEYFRPDENEIYNLDEIITNGKYILDECETSFEYRVYVDDAFQQVRAWGEKMHA